LTSMLPFFSALHPTTNVSVIVVRMLVIL